jgi:WD40 repeat protein
MTYIGHSTGIRQVEPSPGHHHTPSFFTLTTTTDRHQVKVWEVESGKCTMALQLKRAPVCAHYFNEDPRRLLIGQQSGDIQLWDIHNRLLIRSFSHHSGPVRTLSLLPDGYFVSTSEDRTVKVWNSYDSVPVQVIGKPDVCEVYGAAAVHPLSKSDIVVSSGGGVLNMLHCEQSVCKLRSKNLVIPDHVPGGPLLTVPRLAFSPDGRFLAAGDGRGGVQFWDWTSGQPAKRVDIGGQVVVTDCAFSPADPHLFVAACSDGKIRTFH